MRTLWPVLAAGALLAGLAWTAAARPSPDGDAPVPPATPSTTSAPRVPPIDAKAPQTTKTAAFAVG
jgi:hypothetical protein